MTEQSIETASGKNKNTENFPVGSLLIRAHLRKHVHAYYAFARASDDIADNPLMAADEKLKRLTRFEEVLAGGAGDDVPSATGLRDSLKETKITAQHARDLIRAFKQDAVKNRYASWTELLDYCRYSAAPVGRYVLALHAVGEEAWPANDALCSALQVINHLQDCADDYRTMNRVYLPQDDMAACGVVAGDLAHEKASMALRKLLDIQLERLELMMALARDLPRHVPDYGLKCETAIIVVLAEKLLELLKKCDPLSQPVKLSKISVIIAVLTGVFRAFFKN